MARQRGRPSLGHLAATERVSIRVTPQQAAALQQIAGENLTKRATFIRDAIDAAIADYSDRGRLFTRSA